MDDFIITETQLDSGLRGYPVGHVCTSTVDPMKGLMYRNRGIMEYVDMSVEDVLLKLLEPLHDDFSFTHYDQLCIDSEIIDYIYALPECMKTSPMKVLSIGLLLLGGKYGKKDYKEDLINFVALFPHLVATVMRFCDSLESLERPDISHSYTTRFTQFLHYHKVKDQELFLKIMNTFIVLHMDHGGGNLSTFVGKAVASGRGDLYTSLAAAMDALASPRHGGANTKAMEFIQAIPEESFENDQTLKDYIQHWLQDKKPIPGYGHAVLRTEDLRATVFYDLIEKHFSEENLTKRVLSLRRIVPEILGGIEKIQNPYPNVDAASGALLTLIGFDNTIHYTVLFGLSRCLGIAAQIIMEASAFNGGKGTPIYRPKYIYKQEID